MMDAHSHAVSEIILRIKVGEGIFQMGKWVLWDQENGFEKES